MTLDLPPEALQVGLAVDVVAFAMHADELQVLLIERGSLPHARDWALGTPEGDWVSMSVVSDGSYGVPEGLVSSFPVTISDGRWSIVQGLDIDDFSRARIDASVKELEGERDAVKGLGLI